MKRSRLRATLFSCGLLATAVVRPTPIAVWEDLKALADISENDLTLLRSSYCPDGCGFDRTSAGDPRFVRIEGDEAVIFETFNAGAIVRVWMTMGFGTSDPLNEAVRLRLYLDDNDLPTVDVPLPQFFDGSDARWPAPIAGNRDRSSGGNYNYRPFVFDRYARMSLVNAEDQRIWFQIHHRQFSIDEPHTDPDEAGIAALQRFLTTAEPLSTLSMSGSVSLSANALETITIDGPGWVLATSLRTDVGLATLSLRWIFDGSASTWISAEDYFALGDPTAINRSRMIGQSAVGTLYDQFPKPFFDRAQWQLRNEGPDVASVEYALALDDDAPSARIGHFRFQPRSTCPSSLGEDILLLETRGAGRWVGLFQEMDSFDQTRRTYLEGDERVVIDGMTHPIWHGTGVEDFYAGGFYFDGGPFSAPLHGASFHSVDGNGRDTTGMFRFMLSDAVPFQSAIRVSQEVGRGNDIQACSRSVAYFYLRPLVRAASASVDMTSQSRAVTGFEPAPLEVCETIDSCFVDNPQTCSERRACTFEGVARVTLPWAHPSRPARLIRTFDAHSGGGIVETRVNGSTIGSFGPHAPNEARRFAQDLLILPALPGAADSGQIEIELEGAAASIVALELRSEAPPIIHDNGFESVQ